jgi:inhibitor of KinA sporulation pathway (predicted exonuclease)
MNYIVFDLEATCWEKRGEKENEIIEIGAVMINGEKKIVSEFEQFVKPLKNPALSDFCKKLTTIKQSDVDRAPHFNEAIERFKQWINIEEEYILCSWGFYDRKQLKSDSALHNLDHTWVNKHISVKHQYAKIKSLRRPIGMNTALSGEGMSLDGTHHRGIDDARNIAKVFIKYFEEWDFE